ncbi:MAG TPA: C25 family cysteine peptidase [Verrucomicrobiota bacterium]|nr:C25 family cysteine peptidase [Verrucomicrobiota bacterium]
MLRRVFDAHSDSWSIPFSLGIAAALFYCVSSQYSNAAEVGDTEALTVGEVSPWRNAVASIEGYNSGGQVLVRWATDLENGILGFDLYRRAGGSWIKVNTQLVVAENALEGGIYEIVDPEARAPGKFRYQLVAILETGHSLELTTREIEVVEATNSTVLNLESVGRRLTSSMAANTDATKRLEVKMELGQVHLPSSTSKVKILTTATGIHFVSASSLATLLGQTATTVQSWITGGQLSMSCQSNKVVYVPGNGWIAAGQTGPGLFFYAEGIRNNYTTTNVYWLGKGSNTFAVVSGGNPTPQSPGRYAAVLSAEQDSVEARSTVQDPEEDFWFWTRLTANSSSDTWSPAPQFTLDSSLIRDSTVNARLKLRFYGASKTSHLVKVTLTDPSNRATVIGSRTFSGIGLFETEFSFPSDLLGVGANKLTVQALLDTNVSASQLYIDGYELSYLKLYNTIGATAALEAGSEGSVGSGSLVMTVPGFGTANTAPTVLVFDVSETRNPKSINNVTLDKVGTWRASISPPDRSRRYAFLQPQTKASQSFPSGLYLVNPTNLSDSTNQAAYVIVTHSSLTSGADQLALYRGAKFRTKVVQLDDVYNEFGYGLSTPFALSQFLKVAYSQWSFAPRYLVLFGDGTYDYRNLQAAGDNLVPPLMIKTPYGLTTSDSLFGEVVETGIPRIMVGRFPVKTTGEAAVLLSKIQTYENRSLTPPLKALLVADQPDLAGDFIQNINDVEAYLSPAYSSFKVHPDYAPAPIDRGVITNLIMTSLNSGVDLFNYVGHGAVDRFGTVPYVWITQPPVTPNLTLNPVTTNSARLPLVVAMTCVAGMYSSPGYACLGEGLLRASNAGAVAVVSPTGLSQDADAVWINRRIMELLSCNTSSRLGDLVAQSFALYNRQSQTARTPVWIYNILGDPALKVAAVGSFP